MTERAQSTVGFSDHHYRALKTAPDPLWDQYKADEEVVGTEMTCQCYLSSGELSVLAQHVCTSGNAISMHATEAVINCNDCKFSLGCCGNTRQEALVEAFELKRLT